MRGGCDQMPFANLFDPVHAGTEEADAEANAAEGLTDVEENNEAVDGYREPWTSR